MILFGILLAAIAGALVSMQTVFNNKVNEQTGSWTTTMLVLFMGFVASLLASLIFEGKNTFTLQHVQLWYWFSGMIGVGVVFCLVQGMRRLGPTYAISIVLTAQLGTALLWDSLGWLGLEKIPFTPAKLIGVLVIIGGILVFKFGGRKETKSESPVAE
ncbi:DMT family transporter [Paenibacillus nuruki]|jgi:transporter family-2 protein|nr:DMT family transporter [Paenibacillus nuruki]